MSHTGDDNRIGVLVVDAHAVVRDGLEVFLSAHDDIELVGKVSCGEEAIAFCSRRVPDVIVMDLVLPGMDGIRTMRTLQQRHPDARVVILTDFGDKTGINQALSAGAHGFLLKDVTGDELADALRRARAGEIVLAPQVTRLLVESLTETGKPQPYDLTWREQQVLGLMVKGYSNPAIASRLGIKTSTVKTHVGHIFSKLGVASRVEAATFAVERGLLGRNETA